MKDFIIVDKHETIIVPDKHEDRRFFVYHKTDSEKQVFFVEAEYVVSYDAEQNTEMQMKYVSLHPNPKHVLRFIKSFLSYFPHKNKLITNIHSVYWGLNLDLLSQGFEKIPDSLLADKLYVLLPSDHAMNKFQNGGWEDDEGNWHDWPEE